MDSSPDILSLSISDFDYPLPDDRIARYPLEQRDASKLLIFKEGGILESNYANIVDYLPKNSVLVFNNSRVIEARIVFTKPSGGQIEIFCLEPHESLRTIANAMSQSKSVLWICLIGGASKWKAGQILEKKIDNYTLSARFVEKQINDFVIEFFWTPPLLSFAEILHKVGSIPLPPYLKRDAELSDSERYQTVYAKEIGSVAAPTAGLHFTDSLLSQLSNRGIDQIHFTLHVGAGTFLPVKTDRIADHQMHEEFIEVSNSSIQQLIEKVYQPIFAVGTTSLRILESLYWLGYLISQNQHIAKEDLHFDQWFPYRNQELPETKIMLETLHQWIEKQPDKKLITKTCLLIAPGYRFQVVSGLITNFHQPHSTLLLLVAAMIGPAWRSVYTFALENNYRFLSYGDGCLFFVKQ